MPSLHMGLTSSGEITAAESNKTNGKMELARAASLWRLPKRAYAHRDEWTQCTRRAELGCRHSDRCPSGWADGAGRAQPLRARRYAQPAALGRDSRPFPLRLASEPYAILAVLHYRLPHGKALRPFGELDKIRPFFLRRLRALSRCVEVEMDALRPEERKRKDQYTDQPPQSTGERLSSADSGYR